MPQIFDSVGEVRSDDRKRVRGDSKEFPHGLAHTSRLDLAFANQHVTRFLTGENSPLRRDEGIQIR